MKHLLLISALLSAGISTAMAENVTADPADGSVLATLSKITLTWENETSVDNNGSAAITVTDAAGTVVVNEAVSDYGTEVNQMVITFADITTEGTYTVNFPAERYSFLREGGETAYSEAFTLTYTISEGGLDPDHTFTPDGTVGYLYYIEVAFNNYVKAAYKWNATEEEKPYFTDAEGNVVANASIPYASDLANTNKVRIVLAEVLATPGVYTLHVPEGACNVMTEATDYTGFSCPAFTHVFTVTGEGLDNYTTNPSAETPVRNFSSVAVTFPDVDTMIINPDVINDYNRNYYNIYAAGTNSSAGNFRIGTGVVEGNTVTFALQKPIINGGTYVLDFGPDCFLLGEDQHGNSPVHVEIVIDEGEPTAVEITPAPGQTYSRLTEFTFVYPGVTSIKKNPNVFQNIYVYDSNHKSTYAYVGNNDLTIEGNTVKAVLNMAVVEEDVVTLEMPTGFLIFDDDDDKYNTALCETYYVDGSGFDAIECEPANGSIVDTLSTILITYVNETLVANNSASYASITVYNSANQYVATAGMYQNQITAGPGENQATITLNVTLKEKDTYTFKLPGNAFFLGEDQRFSTVQKFEYTVDPDYVPTSLEAIESTTDVVPGIFTIDGRKVEKVGKGIFIVDGKIVKY